MKIKKPFEYDNYWVGIFADPQKVLEVRASGREFKNIAMDHAFEYYKQEGGSVSEALKVAMKTAPERNTVVRRKTYHSGGFTSQPATKKPEAKPEPKKIVTFDLNQIADDLKTKKGGE